MPINPRRKAALGRYRQAAPEDDDGDVPRPSLAGRKTITVIVAGDPEVAAPEQSSMIPNIHEMVAGTAATMDYENATEEEEEDSDKQPMADLSEHTNGMELALTEDIYSLMSTVKVFSVGFVFAFSIFLIQLSMLSLILIDLIDVTDNPVLSNGVPNRLRIPADAGIPVTVAQSLGIVLIVNFAVAEGDMIRGITHLLDGYDPELLQQYPNSTRAKWIMAGLFQFLVGTIMIADAFILMVQSSAVIDMCLNFTALEFIQYFDDAAFALGASGLINRRIRKECQRIGTVFVRTRQRNRTLNIRRSIVVLLTISLYIPYVIISSWKWNGRFMCSSLYVQFGDAYFAELPYYSGRFESLGKEYPNREQGRIVYFDQSGTIKLSYCNGLRAWTFSNITETDENCDYLIKSSVTTGYDIMDVAEDEWYMLTKEMGNVAMDWIAVTCADCSEVVCNPEMGQCVNNHCECHDGFMGLNCEFTIPDCEWLGLDYRSKSSLPSLPFASLFMDNEFVKLKAEREGRADRFYDRPMYVSYNGEGKIDMFIVFTGRRWIIMGTPQDSNADVPELYAPVFLDILEANDNINRRVATLVNVSLSLNDFEPLFFSSPVDYATPSHKVDPTTVDWVLAIQDDSLPLLRYKADDAHELSPNFLCSQCDDETNPCLHDGFCNATTGYCECPESYGGFTCEYSYNCQEKPCLNGGTCNEIFNVCEDCNTTYHGNLCQFKRAGAIDWEVGAAELGDDLFLCFNGTTCLNGGWCTTNVTTCACPSDFAGDYCEELLENSTLFVDGAFICANTSCINDGYCIGDDDECTCLPPFTGRLCEQLFGNDTLSDSLFHCSNSTCLNGGWCENEGSPCACTIEFEGDYCQSSINLIEGHNLCSNETCLNGGYCTSILENCLCPEGFTGDLCDEVFTDSTNAPDGVGEDVIEVVGNSTGATDDTGSDAISEYQVAWEP